MGIETLSPVAERFARAAHTYATHAVVQRQMAACLVDAASPYVTGGGRWFEFGCGTGMLTREWLTRWRPEEWVANDLVASHEPCLAHLAAQGGIGRFRFAGGDAGAMALPQGCQVVWSGAALQWFADVPAMLDKVAAALVPGGVFAFSTFGPDNYCEIRALTGSGLTYHTAGAWQAMADARYEVLVMRQWHEVRYFADPVAVLRHIKATGVGGVTRTVWCKQQLSRFCRGYEQYETPQGFPLTYHPLVCVWRAKGYDGMDIQRKDAETFR
ncbi:malonyl-CoA O-methyltransferase [Breznakibacter xylanolyticus]|uniref:Malonyl-CoA O-methyltransferase n=1 Tax=Breznakibacter xylanolyticus TaxID=990 RepID=A0A2W7NC62_9BACT|nr:malonyl-ACP O-methyltransferase [Breznakibacter xylanolyticus]PZX18035.1 malonyl-CoA O-methyltransferase [Breznakibacter xylanolyticus]